MEQDRGPEEDAITGTAAESGTAGVDEGEEPRKRKLLRRRPRRAPEQTKDDTDLGWGERPDESAHDRWLREQRPPHWGSD